VTKVPVTFASFILVQWENNEMTENPEGGTGIDFFPLTIDRWSDLEKLFGKKGACGGCWCMSWRLPRKQFDSQKGEANKRALKKIVTSGEVPGLLAYNKHEPIAWCSVGPRETYTRLEHSRSLKRIDDKAVWSVVCFYASKPYRKKGITAKLLLASIDYVNARGGKILEGYPVEYKKGKLPDPFVYTGLLQSFLKVGFVEVSRSCKTRAIVRYEIRKS